MGPFIVMKSKFVLLFLILLPLFAEAKTDKYFYSSFQTGYGNAICEYSKQRKREQGGLQTYGLSLGFMYVYKRWNFELGLSYFTSGVNFIDGYAFISEHVYGPHTYYHLGIPVSAGYNLIQTKRLSISGDLGAVASANPGFLITEPGQPRTFIGYIGNGSLANTAYSLWVTASFTANIRFTNRLSFFVRPQVQCIMTDFTGGKYSYDIVQQRNYIAGLALGIKAKI